jgi:drug/metabolite transporter (DMT)-like permease
LKKYQVWILLILCVLFWAGNYIFGSLVVAELTPVGLTFTRWLFASILLLMIAKKVEKPDWKEVLNQWPKILGLSLFGIIGYNLFLYYALYYTSPLNASLVNSFNPGLIAIASAAYLREKISKYYILGIAISFLGVFIVLTKGNLIKAFEINYNIGDLLILAAVIMWTIYSMIGKNLTTVPPITSTAVSGMLSAILLLPFAINQNIDFANISTLSLIGVIYIILFPSLCSFVFWNIGVREIGAAKAGIFMNLNPVFTAAISWIMGQQVTMVQLIGGLLVFAGVYITTAVKNPMSCQ